MSQLFKFPALVLIFLLFSEEGQLVSAREGSVRQANAKVTEISKADARRILDIAVVFICSDGIQENEPGACRYLVNYLVIKYGLDIEEAKVSFKRADKSLENLDAWIPDVPEASAAQTELMHILGSLTEIDEELSEEEKLVAQKVMSKFDLGGNLGMLLHDIKREADK